MLLRNMYNRGQASKTEKRKKKENNEGHEQRRINIDYDTLNMRNF